MNSADEKLKAENVALKAEVERLRSFERGWVATSERLSQRVRDLEQRLKDVQGADAAETYRRGIEEALDRQTFAELRVRELEADLQRARVALEQIGKVAASELVDRQPAPQPSEPR